MTLATPSWSEGVLAVAFCAVRRDQDRRNDKRLNRFLNYSGQRLAETVGPTGRSIVIQLLRLGDAIELGCGRSGVVGEFHLPLCAVPAFVLTRVVHDPASSAERPRIR